MSGRALSLLGRVAGVGLALVGYCAGDVPLPEGTAPASRHAPAVRKIYVPAASPSHWPTGDWDPMRLADFDRRLQRLREELPSPGLERAEYRGRLTGDVIEQGRLEWTTRPLSGAARFISLEPANLELSKLEWDGPPESPTRPALWGTGPDGEAGLVLDGAATTLRGSWSLAGRRLPRSLEFVVRLPAATVSKLFLELPAGLRISSTAGEVSGPRRASAPGWSQWELNLGSRSTCRLWITPPVDAAARRPLAVSQSRTNYVIRPEVVRVLAEFEIEAFESSVRELRLQVDRGLQVVGIEHGDDVGLAVKSESIPEGELYTITFAEPITSPGQVLRVRGISPLKPGETWALPRLKLLEAVASEKLVTIRMQPPFQAADLQMSGYRQTELTSSPTEGETVVLRQIEDQASLVIVPADPKVEAVCRGSTVCLFSGDEWTCTTQLDLQASAGTAFDAKVAVPTGWEIVSVRSPPAADGGGLAHWDVAREADGPSKLHVGFQSALEGSRPQRLLISARRSGLPPEEWFGVPVFTCDGNFTCRSTTVFVPPAAMRPVFERLSGIELVDVSELPTEFTTTSPWQGLTPEQREGAIVVRSSGHSATGEMALKRLQVAADSPAKGPPEVHSPSGPKIQPEKRGPVVAALVEVSVQLSASDGGSDRCQWVATLAGADGNRLAWELPAGSIPIAARLDGELVRPDQEGLEFSLSVPERPGADSGRRLFIEYSLPVNRPSGPQRWRHPLPRCAFPVVRFTGRLTVPAELRSIPTETEVEWARADSSTKPTLGPLARDPRESAFRPWKIADWRKLLGGADSHDDSEADSVWRSPATPAGAELALAANPTYHASSLAMPAELELFIWDAVELQALEWALLLAVVLVTILLRTVAPGRCRSLAAILGFALAFAAFSGLPWLNEISFCALTGLCLGCILPVGMLPGRRVPEKGGYIRVPTGSTQSFTHGYPVAVLLALGVGYVAQAQEPKAPPATEGPTGEARLIDVLIPVDAEGKPVGPEPLVYVRPGILERLEKARKGSTLPPWLLRAVEIEAVVNPSKELRMKARYEVLVLSNGASVEVDFPLENAVFSEAAPCLVDGRPQSIFLRRGGRGVFVELPGIQSPMENTESPPTDVGDTPETDPVTARPPENARHLPADRHLIELQLQALVEAEGGGGLLSRQALPRIPNTRIALNSSSPEIQWLAIRGLGAPPRDVSAGQSAPVAPIELRGPLAGLELRWSTDRPAAPRVTELDTTISALVDLSPNLARSSWHITGRVLSGAVDSLAFALPAEATIEAVQSAGLGGYVIEPAAQGRKGRILILEYSVPQTSTFSATIGLLQPGNSREAQLPLLELTEVPTVMNRATLRLCQVAFRQPLDYRLAIRGATSEVVVKPRAVDEFLKEWPMAGARPQQAIEMVRPGPLLLGLEELSGRLSARAELLGRFSAGNLDWTYSAEIDQPTVPPFQYRLKVDPRLSIRSATVQEDGAERLLRWSRTGETLVLFLNDRAARAQSLRVDAAMPVPAAGDLELPRIALENADDETTRVTLVADAGVSVSLVGNPEVEGEASPEPTDTAPHRIARYEQPSNVPERHVQLSARSATLGVESVLAVEAQGDELGVTATLDFQVTSGRANRFDVVVPEALARQARLSTVPDSQQLRAPVDHERTLLSFFPKSPIADHFLVEMQFVATAPAEEAWTVPEISAPQAQSLNRWLLAPRDRRVELPAERLPAWYSTHRKQAVDATRTASYRLAADAPVPPLLPPLVLDSELVSDRALADFQIELSGTGLLQGQMLLWFPEQSPANIAFDWPDGARPTAALVDGVPQILPPVSSGEWDLPLPAKDRKPAWVWLRWDAGEPREPALVRRLLATCPRPRIPLAAEILTIRVGPELVIGRTEGLPASKRIDLELVRWQAALNAVRGSTAQGESQSRALVGPYLRSVARQAKWAADVEGNVLSEGLRKRLEDLDVRTQQLTASSRDAAARKNPMAEALAPADPGPERPSANMRMEFRDWSETGPRIGELSAHGIWGARRGALSMIIAFAAAVVAFVVVRIVARGFAWIQERESLSLLILGTLWWLILSPSFLGWLFILWGTWRLARGPAPSLADNSSAGR